MNKEVQTLRRQNSNLDSDRHERDKTLNHLRTRVAVLEQELKDKEQVSAAFSKNLYFIHLRIGRTLNSKYTEQANILVPCFKLERGCIAKTLFY